MILNLIKIYYKWLKKIIYCKIKIHSKLNRKLIILNKKLKILIKSRLKFIKNYYGWIY